MTGAPLPSLSDPSAAFCFLLILMIPLACVGLALVNTGLGRARSAAHAMLSSLCVLAVAALVYVILGFSFEGEPGRPAHAFTVAGKNWNWLAAEPLFLRGIHWNSFSASLAVLLQIFGVGLAGLVPVSSGADRWKLSATCASTALLAGLTYPLFAHWVWGGGWLAQLGPNYGLGRGLVDTGGAGTIQVVGGLTALSLTWILGPRPGKYSSEGIAAAIPGHNVVLVLLGCALSWSGWFGLNASGAMLFGGAETAAVVLIAVNTTLAAAASGLTTTVVTRVRFGRPDASLVANGWMAGLVASSAAPAYLKPAAAILVGAVAGGLVPFAVDLLEFKLAVDDPGGAISVHAVGGIWGLLSVALLSEAGGDGQWLAQVVGVATLVGFVLPLTYALNWLLDRYMRQRVDIEGDWHGLDLHELGAGAYPEFDIHGEEFFQR